MNKTRETKKSDSANSLIFGIRPVLEALETGLPLERVFLVKGSAHDNHRNIARLSKKMGVPLKLVPQEKLQRLTKKNHQGVVAFSSPVAFFHIDSLLPQLFEEGKSPLLVLLDGVTDVRNFGAIARSAECFGAHAVIIGMDHSAPINGEAVKSSAGALLSIPICRSSDLNRTIENLKNSGVRCIACSEKAEINYRKADFKDPVCLVMGDEGEGIRDAVLERCDEHVGIPMFGKTESLNVSVSAGIVLAEMAQQRNND
ncbi:MAG: 23S rRNA (guanosine(2251)-2'-O)-methyltransferase RlmB [Cryomorphaceae bacterium]|nr:23S rRNA (guanosine(2251)-2'-O)-methyltransferase RlmB [Cryomorphaceae bacterium]